MENLASLTNKNFWKEYWSKPELMKVISKNRSFVDVLSNICRGNNIKTSLEIGGFPGYFSIFLKKYHDVNPTILDIVIDRETIERLSELNGIDKNTIKIVEANICNNVKHEPKYDLVFSTGFIEHFENTKGIISEHVKFLKENGTLFMTVPNLKRLTGFLSRIFDRNFFEGHNLKCMEKNFLYSTCKEIGLTDISVDYYGKFGVWIENEDKRIFILRLFIKSLRFLGRIYVKLFPFKTKIFSPHIMVIAKKTS